MKNKIRELFVKFKTGKVFEGLHLATTYPLAAGQIKNVLIILPGDETYLDASVSFVRELRNHFSNWNYMMFDIEKLLAHKLNRLDLPNNAFIDELKKENFDLVIDLNLQFDLRIAYLIVLLKIPYRIRMIPTPGDYYNIIVIRKNIDFSDYDFAFEYIKKIFIR